MFARYFSFGNAFVFQAFHANQRLRVLLLRHLTPKQANQLLLIQNGSPLEPSGTLVNEPENDEDLVTLFGRVSDRIEDMVTLFGRVSDRIKDLVTLFGRVSNCIEDLDTLFGQVSDCIEDLVTLFWRYLCNHI